MALLYIRQRMFPWKKNVTVTQSCTNNQRAAEKTNQVHNAKNSSTCYASQVHTIRLDLESQAGAEQSPEATSHSECSEVKVKGQGFKINPRTISDAILGLSDGLTVPFALSAGLSSFGTTRFVILGGLAELVAGAISMGLGGFLGARSELDSYNQTVRNTRSQIESSPFQTSAMIRDIFQPYELSPSTVTSVVKNLQSSPERLLDFLMTFHHKESLPTLSRAYKSAITLGVSYFFGGLIPLVPYFIVPQHEVLTALWWSIGIMGITLLVFGYSKTCVVLGWAGRKNILAGVVGGLQMLLVGAAAAGAAVGLVRAIEHGGIY